MPITTDMEKGLIYIDYRNLLGDMLAVEAKKVSEQAPALFKGSNITKVKVLVDVRGTMMNAGAVLVLKESTKKNSAQIEKIAIIGITGLKKILADAISVFSGTNTKYFETKEQAMDWLMKP